MGFNICIALSSMVVFKIDIRDFAIIDLKRQSSVSTHMKIPDAFSIASKLVSPPLRESP